MLSRRAASLPLRTLSRRLSTAPTKSEVELLEALLQQTKARVAAEEAAAKAAASSPEGVAADQRKFQIQAFNAISPVGLNSFPKSHFLLTGSAGELPSQVDVEPHAVVLRSHKLKSEEVMTSVRAIARCGAGTNNIPIDAMTARGIPVFNTPGANANAVKELVLCGLFLASRGVHEGIMHVKEKIVPEEPGHKERAARIEKDKKHFVGQEIRGKTLAVLGLGNIGAMIADSALALGMDVVGYDPKISVDAAWRLPREVRKTASLEEAFSLADYVSINMPYIKGVTHHVINADVLAAMKPNCHILNFARGEIVDGKALADRYEKGHTGKYICDFADELMQNHPKFICIPHLGASTAEAEDNCAEMAAKQIIKFLETGNIINSVNFPTAMLEVQDPNHTRLCIINENKPGVLGEITTLLGNMGVNISQQLNTSRESVAYNVIDTEGFPLDPTEIQTRIMGIQAVISTRIIFTGSAGEGPSHFRAREL